MKDELILLRCEKEEKKQIKRDAEKHGKTISSYLRYLVAKERKEMGEREKWASTSGNIKRENQ